METASVTKNGSAARTRRPGSAHSSAWSAPAYFHPSLALTYSPRSLDIGARISYQYAEKRRTSIGEVYASTMSFILANVKAMTSIPMVFLMQTAC
jgi:hypothetical protein